MDNNDSRNVPSAESSRNIPEAHVSRRDRIEKSLRNVLAMMVREEMPMVSALCNREVLKCMIDDLDKNCTKKVQKMLERKKSRGVEDPVLMSLKLTPLPE